MTALGSDVGTKAVSELGQKRVGDEPTCFE